MKKFHEFSRYIKESITDSIDKTDKDILNLIQKADQYVENSYNITNNWNSKFNDILKQDMGYRSTAYSIDGILQEIEKEKFQMKKIVSEIQIIMDHLDEEYRVDVSNGIEPEEDPNYQKLENVITSIKSIIDQTEEYKSDVKKVYTSYINLDESINFIRNFKFENL